MIIFAQATAGGSVYALWDKKGNGIVDEMPVIVLGDEGGIGVASNNLADLLRLFSLGSEPSVFANRISYPLPDQEDIDYLTELQEYRVWLNR